MTAISAGGTRGAPRDNQKRRTRAALVAAAAKLIREGRPQSMPDAAAEALVSVATAYRYFTSAEELWEEALQAVDVDPFLDEVHRQIEARNDDVVARAEVATRLVGGWMLAEQPLFRRVIRDTLDRWFAQTDKTDRGESVPVRAGRRNATNELIVEPLRGKLPDETVERLVRALGLVSGAEIVLALSDALGLDDDDAMVTLLDANRWIITGALTEAANRARRDAEAPRRRKGQRSLPADV